MSIPIPDRVIGYVGDNLVETRIFEIDRFYNDIDLAEFEFKLDTEINGVKNIILLDKSVDENKIILTWTIAESHVLNAGHMNIQIRAFKGEVEKWHSNQDYVIVRESINASQSIPSPLPSEFEQYEQRIEAMRDEAALAAQTATEQAEIVVEVVEEAKTDVLPELHQAIEDAGNVKSELDSSIQEAGSAKSALDGSIATAGSAKTELDDSISQAGVVKGQLDGSISTANTAKSELDGSIVTAGQVKEALDESIQTGDLAAFRNEFDNITGGTIIYVSKKGNDSNDGTIGRPKLTIQAAITEAAGKIDGSNPQAAVIVLDAGRYTETISLQDNVHLFAEKATIVGRINIRNHCKVSIYAHYASENSQPMLYKDGTAHAYYRAVISDGRGIAGNLTGTSNIYNITSSSILFAEVELMFVATNGIGVREHSSTTGHIHFDIKDLYLAGNGARGIYAQGTASNIIGKLDHILETGTPNNTTAIQISNPGCVVKITANEIIADTAYNIAAGALYLVCPKIAGAAIGTAEFIPVSKKEHDSLMLKTAKLEKDFNDYRSVISSMNPNQEAKQTATGYGIVSLPKNAANGQVSVTVKGNTETDEEGNTKSTVSAMRLKSVGKNLLSLKSKKILDNLPYTPPSQSQQYFRDYDIIIGATRNGYISSGSVEIYELTENKLDIMTKSSGYGVGIKFKAQAGEVYVKSDNVFGIGLFDKDGNNLAFTAGTQKNITAPANTAFGFAIIATEPNVRQVIENFQVERGTVATPYEPYTESTQYITAKDDEGKIVELRSLPNGTKDEIRVSEGKLIKRVSDEVVLQESNFRLFRTNNTNNDLVVVDRSIFVNIINPGTDTIATKVWTSRTAPRNGASFDSENNVWTHSFDENNDMLIFLPKGLYADLSSVREDLAGTTLTYQLAEPIEIPIQVSGNLIGHPSGTVYIEKVLPDAGIYTDKMTILHQDAPIKRLDKLSKVDFVTGIETELNPAQAVINGDKLSFTHPGLSSGDIVFFEYEYDRESTKGEATVEYYDSRVVVKDSVTNKFYKWTVAVANGVPSITLTEV